MSESEKRQDAVVTTVDLGDGFEVEILTGTPAQLYQSVSRNVVALWRVYKVDEDPRNEGRTIALGPDALLLFPDQEAGRIVQSDLRLPLGQMAFRPDSDAWPTWSWEDHGTPSRFDAWAAWDETQEARDRAIKAAENAVQGPTFMRRHREKPDDFYKRVADFYETAARFDQPVRTLATAADVPRSTASQWVFEARKRGYLPPTRPGLAKRRNSPDSTTRED